MSDLKNINTESKFEGRTGVVVWLKSKRNVKRLMNYGLLHYVSNKMNYALVYVNTETLDKTIERLQQENEVQSVEISPLKELPITYDSVLDEMTKEIEEKKKKDKLEPFPPSSDFPSLNEGGDE